MPVKEPKAPPVEAREPQPDVEVDVVSKKSVKSIKSSIKSLKSLKSLKGQKSSGQWMLL